MTSSGPQGTKVVKKWTKKECNNILAFVGSPRVAQEEVEALKGTLKYLWKIRSCSEGYIRRISGIT